MDVEKVVREYIDKSIHLSLGTCTDGKPWVCEVHFAFDEDLNLYFRSKPTERHSREIEANANVAGNIVRQHVLKESPKGVYFEGTASKLAPGIEQNKATECINQRLQAGDGILDQAKDPVDVQFYKIEVSSFYAFGQFEDRPMQKYQLAWRN